MISINGEPLSLIEDSVLLQSYSRMLLNSFARLGDTQVFDDEIHLVELQTQNSLVTRAFVECVNMLNILTEYQKVLKILLSNSSSSSGQKGEILNRKEV
jgi:hypothetical protein